MPAVSHQETRCGYEVPAAYKNDLPRIWYRLPRFPVPLLLAYVTAGILLLLNSERNLDKPVENTLLLLITALYYVILMLCLFAILLTLDKLLGVHQPHALFLLPFSTFSTTGAGIGFSPSLLFLFFRTVYRIKTAATPTAIHNATFL